MISEKLHDAIVFAAQKHGRQVRKGTGIPYITHPMAACKNLTEWGVDDDIAIAGILHDTLEDTDTTYDELASRFGKRVADMVAFCSEVKADDWRTRKQHTIDLIRTSDDLDAMTVSLADKLANLTDIYTQCETDGFWSRFNKPKADVGWYYGGLIDAFRLKHYPLFDKILPALEKMHRAIWGD